MARLADRTNTETGLCYPSITSLCKDCGLSERAVQKHIRALIKSGFLSSPKNKGGRNKSSSYVLFPGTEACIAPSKPRPTNPVSGAINGARRARNGVPRAPEPEYQSFLNQKKAWSPLSPEKLKEIEVSAIRQVIALTEKNKGSDYHLEMSRLNKRLEAALAK